jgi:hypothetical protein
MLIYAGKIMRQNFFNFAIPLCATIALVVIFSAVIVSFYQMPFTDDVRVFIGAAHQADLNRLPFPWNIDAAWELKPLGNRLIYYTLVRFTEVVGQWLSDAPSEMLIKAAALSSVFIVSMLLARAAKDRGVRDSSIIFFIVFISLVTPYNLFLLQTEWWAVLLSFLVLWMLQQDSIEYAIIAGILSVFIAAIKLSTLLLIPSIFIAYLLMLIPDRDTIIDNVKGYIAGIIVGGLSASAWGLYLPNVVPDMLFSINIAHVCRGGIGFSFSEGIAYLASYMVEQIYWLPILFAGVVTTLLLLIFGIVFLCQPGAEKFKVVSIIGLLGLLWLFPLISVFIQLEFFSYHYMVLAFPAVVSIMILLEAPNVVIPSKFMSIVHIFIIGSVVVFWLLSCSIWSPNFPAQHSFWARADDSANILELKYNLSTQPKLLYLTNADAPYWFHVRSACRYVGSLPILYNMTGVKEYNEDILCIQNYDGEFAIATHEIGNTIPQIAWQKRSDEMPGKFLPNYTKVESLSPWDVYRRST